MEQELGLSKNDFSVPDFNNSIELKLKTESSNFPITLFSATFDGRELFELKRIREKYGIRDKFFTDIKILSIILSGNVFSYWGKYLKMKLYVDRYRRKIFLLIANANGKVIEKRAYWSFDLLESILMRKLKYLALINSEYKSINSIHYFRCKNVRFYELKSFDTFISLLESGIITVCINSGVHKKGHKAGKSYDHGISFRINKVDLEKLYIPICEETTKKL